MSPSLLSFHLAALARVTRPTTKRHLRMRGRRRDKNPLLQTPCHLLFTMQHHTASTCSQSNAVVISFCRNVNMDMWKDRSIYGLHNLRKANMILVLSFSGAKQIQISTPMLLNHICAKHSKVDTWLSYSSDGIASNWNMLCSFLHSK